jgi:hypothetical protein
MCNLPNMTASNLKELTLDRTKEPKATEAKIVKIVVPERVLLKDSI